MSELRDYSVEPDWKLNWLIRIRVRPNGIVPRWADDANEALKLLNNHVECVKMLCTPKKVIVRLGYGDDHLLTPFADKTLPRALCVAFLSWGDQSHE